ncbi:hypothetical protein [Streptomyces sp. CRN 30]|uniref:hypothetical protein n=1 Tax=Streptomyces sp. CRN 30 TaxID=3075613 RepID=UPI002A7F9A12|nr:hypothetical protein [Streptomyces sp. CRN 30]
MDTEGTATAVGAACTLLGVAIGALGTLWAARMQVRGAVAQADAMLTQADTTYRAALDQAHATQRAAHAQWRREIRRDAYAAFVAALDRLEERVTRPELLEGGAGGAADAVATASRAVQAAYAVVELEGPAPLSTLARTVWQAGVTAGEHALRLAPRASALRLLDAAASDVPADPAAASAPAEAARAAHRELTRLRETVFRHDSGEADHAALHAARQRAAGALDASGLFTAEQRRALLGDPSWEGALRTAAEHAESLRRLTTARAEFVSTARDLLDTA